MTQTLTERIGRAAKELFAVGAQEVYLVGSAAGGTMRPGSDVDLAVVGLPPDTYFAAVSAVEDILGCPVDLIDLDEANALTRYLKEEGELVRVG